LQVKYCPRRACVIMVSAVFALAIMLTIIFANSQFVARDKANAKQIQDETQFETKLRPLDKGIYHGAFPNFGGRECSCNCADNVLLTTCSDVLLCLCAS
jgi:hypothetical protein